MCSPLAHHYLLPFVCALLAAPFADSFILVRWVQPGHTIHGWLLQPPPLNLACLGLSNWWCGLACGAWLCCLAQ